MKQDFWYTSSAIYIVLPSLLALVLGVRIYQRIQLALFSDLSKIPGPWYANWTNLWLKWQVIGGNRCFYIHACHQKYGAFIRISPDEVSISDIEAHKVIHRIGSGFNKSDWYPKFQHGSPGIFAMTDPKQHAARRRLFAQAFSNSTVTQYESAISEKMSLATQKINRDALSEKADILKWFTFMATDISGQLSFGKSFDMLQEEKKNQYILDVEMTMMMYGITVELGPIMRLITLLPIPAIQRILSFGKRLDQYGHQAIQNLKIHLAETKGSKMITPTFFSRLLDHREDSGMEEEEIEHEAGNLIIAGSDTTANSLTYVVWALLRPRNQACKKKLLEELHNSISTPKINSKQLTGLPYLNAVIKEGLRLYGAAPSTLPRAVPSGGTVLGGYTIPEGMIVGTQAYTIHRNPAIFPDPEKFDPDRWLNPTKDMNEAFAAWGGGSRICLGIHLATLELQLGITTFMLSEAGKRARICDTTTDKDMEFVDHFLIAPRGGKCEITMVGLNE